MSTALRNSPSPLNKASSSSRWQVLVMMVACIGSLAFSNGTYLFICLSTLCLIYWMLWKNHRPAIMVFAFTLQWLQVITYIFWVNNSDFELSFVSQHGVIAVIESCIGLFLMAAIISSGIKGLRVPGLEEIRLEAIKLNPRKILFCYVVSTLFLNSLAIAFGDVAGLSQIIGTLGSLKWLFFFLYGFNSWARKKWLILILIIAFEFVTGIFSYFSSFKEVLFFSIILFLTLVSKVSTKQFFYGAIISFVVGFLMLTWTAVKGDYRAYLNGGTRQQVISVSRSDAFGKINGQVSNLHWADYQFAMRMLLYRVQYVQHLALTMDRVPEALPYEYGSLWWQNISFVLTPRLLWPDKPIYEATVKTNKYTGMSYAGFKQGSSFSLGYFADSYVDFGYVGMFVPLALLALYILAIYRLLYGFTKINILIRYSVINLIFYEFTSFESDGLFLFGRLTLMLLVFWGLCKFAFPALQRWLYK